MTELGLNFPSTAFGALAAATVLMVASMLSAIRDLPALTELWPIVALAFGAVMVIYAAAAFGYKRRARVDAPSSGRGLTRIAGCKA